MPKSPETVLLTGATGNTGAVLLQLLKERGVAVRALVRNERHVDRLGLSRDSVAIGDFDDAASIAAALAGVA